MAATRRFIDPRALLHHLLDRYERGVASPTGYPDHERFATVTDADVFRRALERAAEAGCIEIVEDRGRNHGRLKFARLVNPGALYAWVGRSPAGPAADAAGTVMLEGLRLHPMIEAEARNAIDAWARNRTWMKLGPDQAPALRIALELAQAIVEKRHLGLDYRTFSRREVSDSKALERLEGTVVKLLRAAIELPLVGKPRAALAALGLERFPPPILLSGPIRLDGVAISSTLPYLGLPPSEIDRVAFARRPEYVLTIENFASFNRHIAEADAGRLGLTVYIGGYPSLAAQTALGRLGSILDPDIAFYHWSDIDPDGVMIFRTIETALERPLLPHLMTIALAEAFGTPPSQPTRLRSGEPAGSAMKELASYMAGPTYKAMEQEQIDPELPGLTSRGFALNEQP